MKIKQLMFKLKGHQKKIDLKPLTFVKRISNGNLTVEIRTNKYKKASKKNPIYVRVGNLINNK